ncbi:MutS-related protein [Jongsikchunia kroppenstedtii]|uniref:MutS-related protein n=1 Tax=Jongsikchunia kroppenstedtii TaxID=1121721 RepID=UPI00035CB9D0|nr:hypothetical protein [Jongsikchunia kroppenstedtii]
MSTGGISILFGDPERAVVRTAEPDYFHDLRLDAVVDAVVGDDDQFDIRPWFYTPVDNPADVSLRQSVYCELDSNATIRSAFVRFGAGMQTIRTLLSELSAASTDTERLGWRVNAFQAYVAVIVRLSDDLERAHPAAAALRAVADYVDTQVHSAHFQLLRRTADDIGEALGKIVYSVRIRDLQVNVQRFEGAPEMLERTRVLLDRFDEPDRTDRAYPAADHPGLNRVESSILELVAGLFPQQFGLLREFVERTHDFIDPNLLRLDRELQFYLRYRAHVEWLRQSGLEFCYPAVGDDRSSPTWATDAFDIALAASLFADDPAARVVANSLRLDPPERMIVVTGPNQGGKTTFARMLGQLHHLAGLGLPIPGQEGSLVLFDEIYTHFEHAEVATDERGKLEDELIRLHQIIATATSRSLVILNETFSSTSLHDARLLGRAVLTQLDRIGVRGVYVTFVDELSRLSASTVSMVSCTDPDDASRRTFAIVRRPADGRAFAAALAEKYHLTFDEVDRRLVR